MRGHVEIPRHHRGVIRALQSGGPAIPDSVLAHIQNLEPAPVPRQRLVRPVLAGAVAVSLALVIAAVLLTLGGMRDSPVVAASGQSRLPAQQDAQRGFAGISYADWGARFRWFKVGGRTDFVDGRRTSTVFYRHTHHRIGYTVIAGTPVAPPDHADVLRVNDMELHRFKLGKDDVVTWVRNGHTCVLAGDVHNPLTLVKLALNS